LKKADYHDVRIPYSNAREILWKTLCERYFAKFVNPQDHVLEMGAGYAHFINNIRCSQRTAIDSWPELPRFTAPGVTARVANVIDLEFVQDASVDLAFASNLFEHLTKAAFSTVLRQLKRKIRTGGQLMLLQPNYRRAYREYFDDFTHITVYSDVSLCDFLVCNGFKIIECKPGFLPLSIKSSLPVSDLLVRLYLWSPWKPMAKQMLVRAVPDENLK